MPRQLTLAQAENLLVERNLMVMAARYQVEATRAARLIAGYKLNPTLTVGAEQIPFYSPLPGSFPRFLKTNPDGAGIVQAIGPLKILAGSGPTSSSAVSQRFLIVTDIKDSSQVVLRQAGIHEAGSATAKKP